MEIGKYKVLADNILVVSSGRVSGFSSQTLYLQQIFIPVRVE